MKDSGPVIDFPDAASAYGTAERKAKYGHRYWIVWRDRGGGYHGGVLGAEALERALAEYATNDKGKPIITRLDASTGQRWALGLDVWRAILGNLRAGVDVH
jgi:hypothetical protein